MIVSYSLGLEDFIGVDGRAVERVNGAITIKCLVCLLLSGSRFDDFDVPSAGAPAVCPALARSARTNDPPGV